MPLCVRDALRRSVATAASALLLVACSDSTGPDPTGLTGEWDYVIADAQAEGVSCKVEGLTLRFFRQDGSLSGTVAAEGTNQIQCVFDEEERTSTVTGSASLNDLVEGPGSIAFTFDVLARTWTHTGTLGSDVMTGTVTLFVTFDLSAFELSGEWTATRR
jgi:hypothetical protein